MTNHSDHCRDVNCTICAARRAREWWQQRQKPIVPRPKPPAVGYVGKGEPQ